MTATAERRIVKAIKTALEARGWIVVKLHGGTMQTPGLPDLLCLRNGRAIFLEVKRDEGQATILQKHWLGKLNGAGFAASIVRSVDEALEVAERKS